MGSSKGGSDTEEAKVPKLEEEEGEEKRHEVEDEKVEEIDLGLIETGADLDELVAAPAATAPPPPPPPPQQQTPAVKLPLTPLGNPKAKHCYDK